MIFEFGSFAIKGFAVRSLTNNAGLPVSIVALNHDPFVLKVVLNIYFSQCLILLFPGS